MIPPEDSSVQSLPGKASVEEGLVLLDGPNGVAVTMTAYAASETGKSLIEAARMIKEETESEKL
ncbi:MULTISPECIES: hypothetical protein [unclassified Sphingobium]|uniref:hypothetical protein n=1 Tax=unclassified Sphingobium TaxID=2611147 RepID=UPI000D17AD6C|nr:MULTISPECIES: hypothetical protein [unclassified Sphingobium]MBG6119781.1 hypothetical protein [Sphingobium sp. JAI105]PSO10606.1 hypothetical protein C7E20_16530 [Sphingobium sp. AEW4]TWD01207.1 hypothetical protein FB595_11767 [Sphingobium sp. AEW010]TWD19923.1 hypothetical protein FB596_11714 [Sphingobium sp. AEW013]TWD22539.1 hypothetical protein FB594_11714 [Sphingobium sp. AEW001]